MKCPHCGSQFVVHSENRISDFIRAVARSNKWHCGDCHMKWKTRARRQGLAAREVLGVCLVSLLAFVVLKFSRGPGLASTAEPGNELRKGAALESGDFQKISLSQKFKLKDAFKGGGVEGVMAKFIAAELSGKKLSSDYKRQLREQHKDAIAKMSPAEKRQVKNMIKQMNLE